MRQKKHILVVEDEWLVREVIVRELEDAGHKVTAVETGPEAVACQRRHAGFDLLFTDIRLPGGVDGWQVAEALRAAQPDLPVIYASGYMFDPPRPVENSVLLAKPCRASDLLCAIEFLLKP